MGHSKGSPKRKVIAMSTYVKNTERSQKKQPNAKSQTPKKTRTS
jgi:hypothetical protein